MRSAGNLREFPTTPSRNHQWSARDRGRGLRCKLQHQPALRYRLHPGTNVAEKIAYPEIAEVAVAQSANHARHLECAGLDGWGNALRFFHRGDAQGLVAVVAKNVL